MRFTPQSINGEHLSQEHKRPLRHPKLSGKLVGCLAQIGSRYTCRVMTRQVAFLQAPVLCHRQNVLFNAFHAWLGLCLPVQPRTAGSHTFIIGSLSSSHVLYVISNILKFQANETIFHKPKMVCRFRIQLRKALSAFFHRIGLCNT